ncbi:MAG TPA: glycosyltransferase [Ignavibacteria bacterium]|nr:glycosyltransferase [Ignavibacteria bacterium]
MKISVLMPVYNSEKYLETSIRSVLNQTYQDYEFLIIDDGSTDNSEKIIKKINDSRIKYFKNTHSGLAATLNYGLKNATGEYIARIDSDDLNLSHWLENSVKYLKENPQTDVLSSAVIYFKNNKVMFFWNPPLSDTEIKKNIYLHNPINHTTVLFNKDKILSYGGYDESYIVNEDFELWFRLKDKCTFHNLSDYLGFKRFHKSSLSHNPDSSKTLEMLLSDENVNNNPTLKAKVYLFYGNKSDARAHLLKKPDFKNIFFWVLTFLPQSLFVKLRSSRIKLILKSKLKGTAKYNKLLKELLEY